MFGWFVMTWDEIKEDITYHILYLVDIGIFI